MPPSLPDPKAEWLETDGMGGYASGTVSGVRTRRYHALLLSATTPPTGRMALVNGYEAWAASESGSYAISSQFYAPRVAYPEGARRIESFQAEPWPQWRFLLEDGVRLEQEIFISRANRMVVLSWKLTEPRPGVRLSLRPLLSGRDYHALHHENPNFKFEAQAVAGKVIWQPYAGLPSIIALFNGSYSHQPEWYRNFLYEEEQARGLDCTEDLASPGVFTWDLSRSNAVWMLTTGDPGETVDGKLLPFWDKLRREESHRRKQFPSRLHRAGDAYQVARGKGRTILAGYPWFTDWGRDTFVAMRGLCLATGRLDEAREILLSWAGAVSEGMLPNRFPDQGDVPEFNSVDASLWYIVVTGEFLKRMESRISAPNLETLKTAVQSILTGYARGARFGIRLDDDGLLAAGEPGVQLTWMDAKVGDWVVTPRIGKPVEIQALWLNALRVGSQVSREWNTVFTRGLESFRRKFWNEETGGLYDVVDNGHQRGCNDAAVRPNQIFAVGGLPFAPLDGDRARSVVDLVEKRLWTPLGLRTLASDSPGYCPHYCGGVRERDGAYHQGTVWPWLIGPFVEAWLRARDGTDLAKKEARQRFLDPLIRHLDEAGLGHVSEIADGDAPHAPRGCPFQAWSVGEALRLEIILSPARRSSASRF